MTAHARLHDMVPAAIRATLGDLCWLREVDDDAFDALLKQIETAIRAGRFHRETYPLEPHSWGYARGVETEATLDHWTWQGVRCGRADAVMLLGEDDVAEIEADKARGDD